MPTKRATFPDLSAAIEHTSSPCRRSLSLTLALLLMLAVNPTLAAAANLPTGFAEETIGGSWNEAVGMQFMGDGKLFVWERPGRIYIVENGVKQTPAFLDISEEVGGWRDFGLLGVAFHPDFYNNGYVYLYYVVDRHHLMEFGTGSYSSGTNEYFDATQGRITRYTAVKGQPSDPDYSNATSVDLGSRYVIHGDQLGTGCAILYESHGTGHLIFGSDGTLLAACGDGASYSTTDPGSISHTYYAQAISDGIMRPEENVGAYRSQMLSSLSGKILRLDPLTGLGVPSNPYYDAGDPASTQSKVWALGLRNPYRMVLKPDTGEHDPALADPGTLYIGDVGWGTWEDLQVSNAPGQNFGWPTFEGLENHNGYTAASPPNPDAPNPLYDGTTCTQEYFEFTDLLQQASLDPAARFPNPCDNGQDVPGSIPTFFHERPTIDMRHGATGGARWGSFDGFDAITVDVGAAQDPMGKSVPGPLFGANTSTAGVFYTGTQFPSFYQGKYLHAEWDHEWIKVFEHDANDQPVEVTNFASNAGGVVFVSMDPSNGDLYYISWTALLYRVWYVGEGNAPPTAVASQDVVYGPTPLSVQFTGDQSTDPEALPLSYEWDFGDGSPLGNVANPSHIFSGTIGVPEKKTITLTVTDDGDGDPDESNSTTLDVWLNNTPPTVTITSPADGTLYSVIQSESYDLVASYSDLESANPNLTCEWIVALHHNGHFHSDPPITDCTSTTEIAPVACDPANTYFWRIHLTLTDEQGLSTHQQVDLQPDSANCPNTVPYALNDSTSIAKGLSGIIDVTGNDFDIDGAIDPATVTIVASPNEGSISDIDPVTGFITYLAGTGAPTFDTFTYTVDDDDGDPSNIARVNITTFNTPPTVSLTSPLDGDSFNVGETINLAALVDDAEDIPSLTRDWAIDLIHDGVVTADVYSHSGATPPGYLVPPVGAPGDHVSYLVRVTVTDAAGDQASDQANLYPAVLPPGLPPEPSLSANPTSGPSPLVVSFDASATTDPDGDLVSYSWDFGDGAAATGAVVQHTYTGQSAFAATLTVTDSIGMANSAAVIINTALNGVNAEYYDDIALSDPVTLTRVDSVIDFDWGNGSPDAVIPNNDYSARWTGQIVPLYDESYTYYISIDDGGRLWIDDVLVIDKWFDQGETEHPSAPIAMTASVPVSFKFEWYENGGAARARLRWSSASQAKEIIPSAQLQGPPAPNEPPVAVYDGAGYDLAGSVDVDVLANDSDDLGALDPASIVTSSPLHGSLSVNTTTGVITYTHDGSPTSTDFYYYSVDDTSALSSNTVAVLLTLTETCGDGVVSGSETCDDSNTTDGDCCSSSCQLDIAGTACSDDDACTDGDSCDGGGACDPGPPLACDDGLFCTGLETCEPVAGCLPGTPPIIDDGVACTDDSCDEANDVVVNAVNHGNCDNGLFCDGAETCDALLDCQAGAPPDDDDGVACTDDSCDEANDVVVNAVNHGNCDNGLFCDGAETCDALLDCQAGAPPDDDDGVACTVDSCSEAQAMTLNLPDDAACDDGDACTADSCDQLAGCANDPIPGCGVVLVPTGSGPGAIAIATMLLMIGFASLMLPIGRNREAANR